MGGVGINLSRAKQAKLSRAEEWTDNHRTKEVRERLAGGEDGETKESSKREEKRGGKDGEGEGGEGESHSPLGLMLFLFEALNLYEQTHQLHVHTRTHKSNPHVHIQA